MVEDLLISVLGDAQSTGILKVVARSAEVEKLAQPSSDAPVQAAELAEALGLALFAGLLTRVPSGARYVAGKAAAGEKVVFDHGALRTVLWPCMG